jgi:hypothetical protein
MPCIPAAMSVLAWAARDGPFRLVAPGTSFTCGDDVPHTAAGLAAGWSGAVPSHQTDPAPGRSNP